MQDSEYRNTWGISQSAIKDFQFKSPKKWKEIWIDRKFDIDKNEDNFTMGSLIDTLLFSPDQLTKRFFVGEEKLPSKAIAHIIKKYYEALVKERETVAELNTQLPEEIPMPNLSIDGVPDLLIECANNYCFKDGDDEKCGWQSSWKDDTKLRTLIEKGSDYFESLKASAGRKIISIEMNIEALQLRDILYNDPETRDYFISNEDNDLLFQLELYTTYPLLSGKDMPLKGALDIVRFNHKNKTAQIIDFKSSYSAFGFIHSIKQFGYCDQLSYYDFLLREWMIEACDGKYCGYVVIPPINIVIDINDRIPYIYEYDWKDIALAADGNREYLFNIFQTHDHNQRIKRGWKKILDEIGWHWQNQKWNRPMEAYLNGKIKVNLLNG